MQPSPSSILTIANPWYTVSKVWTCVKPEFRLCWMKLCSSDNLYTTANNHYSTNTAILANCYILYWSRQTFLGNDLEYYIVINSCKILKNISICVNVKFKWANQNCSPFELANQPIFNNALVISIILFTKARKTFVIWSSKKYSNEKKQIYIEKYISKLQTLFGSNFSKYWVRAKCVSKLVSQNKFLVSEYIFKLVCLWESSRGSEICFM